MRTLISKLIIVFPPNLNILVNLKSYMEVQHLSWLAQVKENDQLFNMTFLFSHFLHSSVSDSKS